MANNKVQLSDGTVLLDLTGDTVAPENLLFGATAHNAAGEQIVGAVTAGGGITNFPTIEEVKANWTAVNLITNNGGDVIHLTSSIIIAFITGNEFRDISILFLEVNQQDQDFSFQSLCHNNNSDTYVFQLYLDRGAINCDITVSNVLSGETGTNDMIQDTIYYTTADNFFSK